MAAASSALVKRLVSRCSITAPSRIIHTHAGQLVLSDGPVEFKNPPCIQQKQTAEGFHFRVDMPGHSKEDVEFTVVDNMVVIESQAGKELFRAELELPDEKLFNEKAIKAEMKNGMLTAFLPKIKDEERSDVVKVNIL